MNRYILFLVMAISMLAFSGCGEDQAEVQAPEKIVVDGVVIDGPDEADQKRKNDFYNTENNELLEKQMNPGKDSF